jgi:hypoxia up-regulated 1
MDRLLGMDQIDRDRAAREEAFNTLEAYLYRARDYLEDEDWQKFASSSDQVLFKEKMEEVSEWLFSSQRASPGDFWSKLSELK